MKMTPLEIRQKSFNKKLFGGVDADEVAAFLASLSSSWDRLLEENREMKFRLENAERDANQFREVQSALYKAIKTAEDKHAELIENGTQQAQFLIREAKANAENTIKDAEWRSKTMVDEAEQVAKNTYKELKTEVNGLRSEYQQLEGMRQLLLSEIKNFSNELLERVDRAAIKHVPANFDVPPMPSYLAGPEKKHDDQLPLGEAKPVTPARPFTRVNNQSSSKKSQTNTQNNTQANTQNTQGNAQSSSSAGPSASLADEIISSYSNKQPAAKAEDTAPIYSHNALSSFSEPEVAELEEELPYVFSESEPAVVVQLSTDKQVEEQQIDKLDSSVKNKPEEKETVQSGSFFDNV